MQTTIYQYSEKYWQEPKSCITTATALISELFKVNLIHIILLSDDSLINGSELVQGLNKVIPDTVVLAGNGNSFSLIQISLNRQPHDENIISIVFYGDVMVTYNLLGGWEMIDLERMVIMLEASVLFQLNDNNALNLCKRHFGDKIEHLSVSALLFSSPIVVPEVDLTVTWFILSLNTHKKSVTFMCYIPVYSKVFFIKSNFNKLMVAVFFAQRSKSQKNSKPPRSFSLLINCARRKLVLYYRTGEELEDIADELGNHTLLSDFILMVKSRRSQPASVAI